MRFKTYVFGPYFFPIELAEVHARLQNDPGRGLLSFPLYDAVAHALQSVGGTYVCQGPRRGGHWAIAHPITTDRQIHAAGIPLSLDGVEFFVLVPAIRHGKVAIYAKTRPRRSLVRAIALMFAAAFAEKYDNGPNPESLQLAA